jgi:5'-3' exonuclease
MKKHIFLVDGNSLAHANHNANVLTVGDMQVQAIYGMLRSLHALVKAPGNHEIIVLWDGRAQWRLDIYPEYKGNRTPLDAEGIAKKEAFKRQTPFIEKALELLGIKQIRSPLLEADDLAGYLARALSARGFRVTLVSGDKDWIALVDQNVTWFDPIRDRTVDLTNLLERTGYYTTEAFVQGKALVSDVSDNIPGIPGMGDKGSALFLAKWQDVNEFFHQVDAGEYTPAARKDKKAKSLHPEQVLASPEGRAIFHRNVQLMDLRKSRRPEPGEVVIRQPAPNAAGFLQLCQRLAFASIVRTAVPFLSAFGISHTPQA